jgi:hypothetical protein
MIAVFSTIDMVLGLYTWIIIGSAIFSWLYAFNVINANNRFVGMIGEFSLQGYRTCSEDRSAVSCRILAGLIYRRSCC